MSLFGGGFFGSGNTNQNEAQQTTRMFGTGQVATPSNANESYFQQRSRTNAANIGRMTDTQLKNSEHGW